MKKTTQIPSKVDLPKPTAGDMVTQQEAAAALFFAWPCIFMNSHHPAAIQIPLFVPFLLPPLELLPSHPAPPQHDHHHPRQQPYPRQHLALASPFDAFAKEMLDFAKRFKRWRVRLGFTQTEVSLAVNCCQTAISNFENLQLSFKRMDQMKPQLETWLDEQQRKVIAATTFAPRP